MGKKTTAVIGPRPQYPTPWRLAEKNGKGHRIVVCDEGHYVAECPTDEAAEVIVQAVNQLAGAS